MSTRRKVSADEIAAMSQYRRDRVRTCVRCNGWFLPSPHEYGRATLYCSDDCAAAAKAERRRTPGSIAGTRLWTGKAVRYYAKTCEHCQRSFHPERAHARYCSGKCRVAAHRALRGTTAGDK